jgi:hypothetical protein
VGGFNADLDPVPQSGSGSRVLIKKIIKILQLKNWILKRKKNFKFFFISGPA